MREVRDKVRIGLICQICGRWMDDLGQPDFIAQNSPRICEDCKEEDEQ